MKITSTKVTSVEKVSGVIVGPSAIGKTSLLRTYPNPKEILLLDIEGGTLSLMGTDIDTVQIKTTKDLHDTINFLKTSEATKKYKLIYVDSLTELSALILEELKPQFGKDGYKLWGNFNDLITAYVKGMKDLPFNVFFTCLDWLEVDGMVKVRSFNMPGNRAKNSIKAWFDLVLDFQLYKSKNGEARMLATTIKHSPLAKDRSGVLEEFEEPHLGNLLTKLSKGETQ